MPRLDPASLFDLSTRTAVVIGATGALGGAIAQALGECGAHVFVVGRSPERGAERVASIEAAGGRATFAAADTQSADDLKRLRSQVLLAAPTLDILVNAAGGNRPDATLPPGADFCALSPDAWSQVFDLNLVGGVLLPCQVLGAPMVEAGGGSIINIASLSGMTPLSRVVAYSAAKAAALNLTQFLAREWALRGVRVNALSPGFSPLSRTARFCCARTAATPSGARRSSGTRRWHGSGARRSWPERRCGWRASGRRAL